MTQRFHAFVLGIVWYYNSFNIFQHTVDGRNPAPPKDG
jgi:hypothetical protein